MEQTINGRQYKNFASPLSQGIVQLRYSGTYRNPGYNPSSEGIVHGYDIGGTLAGAKDRDEAIRKILNYKPDQDVKNVVFSNAKETQKISNAQEKGILTGEIKVNTLDGVVSQLTKEKKSGEDSVLITVGTYQMARSFIHGAGIEEYVTALVTSEEAGTGNKKTTNMYVRIYEKLRKKGKIMETYCDDSENDAKAAMEASKTIKGIYGKGFTVYLVNNKATEAELGRRQDGIVVIRNISEKGAYDNQISVNGGKNDR